MHSRTLTRCLLASAVSMAFAGQASAEAFTLGEIKGHFDSTLSIGESWSTANPDKKLIDVSNGGTGHSSTGDDNRLNYGKGDAFSKIFKGVHELQLDYEDTSVFVRGKYWYDFEQEDESHPFKEISDKGREMASRSAGTEFLDAYVSQKYELADRPGNARFGQQVISWGESTFYGNSINSINPLDVAALRRPGSELKEGLIPVKAFYVSQSLTESLSVEGFYQLQWKPYTFDNCGTFFGSDVVAKGCNNNMTAGFADTAELEPQAAALGLGYGLNGREGVFMPREKNDEPRDSGQYGLAMHWLNDGSEYGLYYLNYHSRIPFANTRTAKGVVSQLDGLLAADPSGELAIASTIGNSSYYLTYPEDIHLFGASFATTLPTGTAWSGEISYRPNEPIDINGTDVGAAVLNPVYTALTGSQAEPTMPSVEGQVNQGYKRKPVTQIQSTLMHIFDPVLGAETLIVLGEAAVTHIGDLESKNDQRYGRDSVFGDVTNSRNGYYSATSWGYTAMAQLEYSNVFAGINLKPNVAWSHDVHGYSPVFNEGSKAVSVGVDADYRSTYTASLSYTNFFGGDFNTNVDRDFVALSFGVNF
ncbi:DUF1302 domain-containing protein [Pseudomonas knackmussii]|uniref:DUF1302 domain-containing protein n=1 Tax=Pseudomonas knackmussii TaxID=65741 RepID=UPI003F49F855